MSPETAISDPKRKTITESLRQWAWAEEGSGGGRLSAYQTSLLTGAADEIEQLRQRVADEALAAQGMSADLSRFVDEACKALCDQGGWDEIDGDGSPESIIAERIRNIADHDAPRWWDE